MDCSEYPNGAEPGIPGSYRTGYGGRESLRIRSSETSRDPKAISECLSPEKKKKKNDGTFGVFEDLEF